MNNFLQEYILTLICPDRPGIVHEVSGVILESDGNILESAQFDDPETNLFCMRICFAVHDGNVELDSLKCRFANVAAKYAMSWELFDRTVLPRVLIMVSKFDHCLRDLLYRQQIGELAIDVVCVVSNHRDAYQLSASYDIPFFHLPVSAANKREQEAKLLGLIDQHAVDFVVLARYMQILSERNGRPRRRTNHRAGRGPSRPFALGGDAGGCRTRYRNARACSRRAIPGRTSCNCEWSQDRGVRLSSCSSVHGNRRARGHYS